MPHERDLVRRQSDRADDAASFRFTGPTGLDMYRYTGQTVRLSGKATASRPARERSQGDDANLINPNPEPAGREHS